MEEARGLYWDRAFQEDHGDRDRVRQIYTLSSDLYWNLYGNRRLGNTGSEYGWVSWLHREYGQPRPDRVLELGCGIGDLTIDLMREDFAASFVAIDNSEVGVQSGRKKAAGLNGAGRAARFQVGDLNTVELPENHFDMVVAQMSIHHVDDLEHLFAEVARSLLPGGVFAINEYVGPNRWQFTRMQVWLANQLLRAMPSRLREHYPHKTTKSEVLQLSIAEMIEMDPSEAIRSEDIIPVFEKFFTVEQRRDYGGSLSILVLDNIVGNFTETDPESVRWFKRILRTDHWARRLRLVPVTNVVMAGRPRSKR